MTPELEYLQVKWAAHLSYATATALLSEVLLTADTISVSGVKRRMRVVGAALEKNDEQHAAEAIDLGQSKEPAPLTALAVDSAWLRHCHPPRRQGRQGRHVNLVAGRAYFENGKTRLYAYVHSQVPSAAIRLNRFLTSSGVRHNERVTILTGLTPDLPHPRLVPHRHEIPGCRLNGEQSPEPVGAKRTQPV